MTAAAFAFLGTAGAAHASEDPLGCAGVNGAFYRVESAVVSDAAAECVATWLDETGSPFVPEHVWDSAEYSYGFIAAALPTPETLDRMHSDGPDGPTCEGCRGVRAFLVSHSWAKEKVGYRIQNFANETISKLHAHGVLIHNASSSSCVGTDKYDGTTYFAQSSTVNNTSQLVLPDSAKKKGFNDRYTVAGTQTWWDDGGEWGMGAEFDLCKQFH